MDVADFSEDEMNDADAADHAGLSRSLPKSQKVHDVTRSHKQGRKPMSISNLVHSSAASGITRSSPRQSTILGPMEEGLPELTPSDERFERVMSYRRYRLIDANSVLDDTISRNLGIWIRRLKHQMERNIFDGKRPVAILNFFAAFKKALDGERIPEAGALQILPHFLDGSPKDIYEGMMDDANAGCGAGSLPGCRRFNSFWSLMSRTITSSKRSKTWKICK